MKVLIVVLSLVASTAFAETPEVLTQTARNVARDGRCEALPAIGARVYALDPSYYAQVYAIDPVIAGCTRIDAHLQLGAPPSLTPRRVDRIAPRVQGKDPGTALGYSLGVTLGGVGTFAVGAVIDQPAVATLGVLAFAIGPTMGHVYADHAANTGLAIRSAGLLAGAVGAGLLVNCIAGCQSQSLGDVGAALFIGGGITYVVGSVYEIGIAPEAAHRYNREHGFEATVVPTGNGLALAGRF